MHLMGRFRLKHLQTSQSFADKSTSCKLLSSLDKNRWIPLTCLCSLRCAVVTGATSGIGKAYASEVSLQRSSTAIYLHYLVQLWTCDSWIIFVMILDPMLEISPVQSTVVD